jgi:hypothetical protein
VGSSFRKGTPGINHDGAWRAGDAFCIAEVKSITSRNEVVNSRRDLDRSFTTGSRPSATASRP